MTPRGMIGTLEPLLRAANRHPERAIAFHPCRWNVVNLVIEALGGEWDLRLRISPNVSPNAVYLVHADPGPLDAATPISRVLFQAEVEGLSAPADRLETTEPDAES